MRQYLDLLRDVTENGVGKEQRATVAGESVRTRAVFGRQTRYDLRAGFPLVTTKEVSFDQIRGELLWFLSGSTNNSGLASQGINIWKEWADPETGELGPIYGQQWRRWASPHGGTVDQIDYVEKGIRAVIADPRASAGRRLILTAWNPADIGRYGAVPFACHTLAQFDVTDGALSCHLYQRSADLFLGVPYNIASYALLTHLLAHVTGLAVGDLIHTFGDAHIYDNARDQVAEQLNRTPFALPVLRIDPSVSSMDGIAPERLTLENYRCHGRLRAKVAV